MYVGIDIVQGNEMGLQHYTQYMSRIPLKYHCFTQNIHTLRLSVGGHTHGRTDGRTDAQKIFTQYKPIGASPLIVKVVAGLLELVSL